MTQPQILAHIGALGRHDMWVVAPMALLGFVLMLVMARPKAPTPDDAGPPSTPADDASARDR